MHPILAHRRWLALYLGASIPLGGLLAVLLANAGGWSWIEAAALGLPLSLLQAFIALSAWYPCRSAPLALAGIPRLTLTHALGAVVSSSLWLLAGRAVALALGALGFFPGLSSRYEQMGPLLFTVGLLLYLLAAAVHYLGMAYEASRRAEKRALELAVLAREAELRALRAQIDPHFLFNSLNSVSALVGSEPARAREMCLALAEFLRRTLDLGSRERVPLADELALAAGFLAIEKVRFGTRLAVEQSIENGCGACPVPPLLLQPLVENAVAHGVAHLLDGGRIRLEARREGRQLHLAIENRCDPERPRRPGRGLGLLNVRKRLQAVYGSEAQMKIEEGAELYRVTLRLPAQAPAEP